MEDGQNEMIRREVLGGKLDGVRNSTEDSGIPMAVSNVPVHWQGR
jgi:hypothetical protein